MTRFAVAIAACAVTASVVAMPAVRSSAAPNPSINPAPVAIQYDEISRIVMAPATPPPPGGFAADYQLAMSSGSSTTAMATPAPKHHGLGNLIAAAANIGLNPGNAGQAVAGAIAQEAVDNVATNLAMNAIGSSTADMMKQFSMLQNGHVTRYTYYASRSWIREEDPASQTATISKCREHRFITLDLAKKTYRISDTTPGGCTTTPAQTQSSAPASGNTHVENAAPGTMDLTLSASAQNLGTKNFDGVNARGSNGTFEMAMTNATGSCHNGDVRVADVTYVSNIEPPRAYCPLTTPKYVPTGASEMVQPRGGCKPRVQLKAGAMPASDTRGLALYSLMTMSAGSNAQKAQPNSGFSTLLERGHVAWLQQGQADLLFSIPAGFTEVH